MMKAPITSRTLGDIGQWLSVLCMGYGIILCYQCKLDSGSILFCVGTLLETIATKIKYYGDLFIERNRNILDIVRASREETNTDKETVVDGQGYLEFPKE